MDKQDLVIQLMTEYKQLAIQNQMQKTKDKQLKITSIQQRHIQSQMERIKITIQEIERITLQQNT